MSIGPIQMVVIGFETNDRFKGEIMQELDALRGRGVIRVLDLLFVMKDEAGDIFAFDAYSGNGRTLYYYSSFQLDVHCCS